MSLGNQRNFGYRSPMADPASLAIVIPALNAAVTLPRTIQSVRGHTTSEIVVVDGGSEDDTRAVAETAGARVIVAARGRGLQLAAGAAVAASDWLLFLHADTVLDSTWRGEVGAFIADPRNRDRHAVFRFALDDRSPAARRLERIVAWRTRVLALPYGDQGLLIARSEYVRVGGFRPLAVMEDVDLIRRLPRARRVRLTATAQTSAARYLQSGYLRRSARNLACLGFYFLGLPPRWIARLYG